MSIKEFKDKMSSFTHTPEQPIQTACLDSLLAQHPIQFSLLQAVIEDVINGILILTEQGKLIYANHCAYRILNQFQQNKLENNLIPKEIWHLCQSLIQSRNLFPKQQWMIESRISGESSVNLHIRVQWFNTEFMESPCLLLTIKDRKNFNKSIVFDEAQRYGLTAREKEIWLLYRAGYTYKQISMELSITANTVKKHMKSIYSKQKIVFDTD